MYYELWSDGGYIGTVGYGTNWDLITNHAENLVKQEGKGNFRELKYVICDNLLYIKSFELFHLVLKIVLFYSIG